MKFVEFTYAYNSEIDKEVMMTDPNKAKEYIDFMNTISFPGKYISYKVLSSEEAKEFIRESFTDNITKLAMMKKYYKCYGK